MELLSKSAVIYNSFNSCAFYLLLLPEVWLPLILVFFRLTELLFHINNVLGYMCPDTIRDSPMVTIYPISSISVDQSEKRNSYGRFSWLYLDSLSLSSNVGLLMVCRTSWIVVSHSNTGQMWMSIPWFPLKSSEVLQQTDVCVL